MQGLEPLNLLIRFLVWMKQGYFIHLALFLYAGLKFLDIAEEVMRNSKLMLYDRVLVNFVNAVATPEMTAIMKFMTDLGAGGPYFIVFLAIPLVLLVKNRLRDAALLVFSLCGGVFWMTLMKDLFGRARPVVGSPIHTETGYSFPSGHSTVAACFYGYLIYLVIRSGQPLWIKASTCLLLVALILLTGLSRVYLGVHYPSDVLAGFCLGTAWLSLCTLLSLYFANHSRQPRSTGISAEPHAFQT